MSINRWIHKEDIVPIYNGILAMKRKNAICSNIDGHGNYHTERSKPDREKQISYGIAYMWVLEKKATKELIYRTEKDS